MMDNHKQGMASKILLVDHQKATSKNTTFLLRLAGYEVMIAKGLDEAVNIVTVFYPKGDSPAVILIDNLLTTSGLREMIELLPEDCQRKSILVVKRGDMNDELEKMKYRIVAPRHVLSEIRRAIFYQALSDNPNDNFCRFHATK